MKVLILAGGFGTRLAELTNVIPKPMAEIGGRPILWHIMKIYSFYGYNEFVILCGYKGDYIKNYFANYFLRRSDVTFDLRDNSMEIHRSQAEPWKVTLLDTGLKTMTGGRIKRAADYIGDEKFLLTYGDGVSDVNVSKLMDFHNSHNGLITMTTVDVSGRYGAPYIGEDNKVESFIEKPTGGGNWINGGFFICDPKVLDYIPEGEEGDKHMFEHMPMQNLAKDGELYAYKHEGFWQCMDTLADKNKLEGLWKNNDAAWTPEKMSARYGIELSY
ncbi:MAG: glucose-1-phosphate cytidylyltransferase [Bacteroidota bacterium]